MINQPLWQPQFNGEGHLIAICLNNAFARWCDRVLLTDELKQSLEEYIWQTSKLGNKTMADRPDTLFTYWGSTDMKYESLLGEGKVSLLISGVYAEHFATDGKWLMADTLTIPADSALSYSFHHIRFPGDHMANRWLQLVFSRWVQFAEQQLKSLTGAAR